MTKPVKSVIVSWSYTPSEGRSLPNWNGNLSVNQEMIARQATRNQRLDDARRLRSTLVGTSDGQWLSEVLDKVSKMKLGSKAADGVVTDVPRQIHFRSKIAEHNLDDTRRPYRHYRQYKLPKGSFVIKSQSGKSFKDLVFLVVTPLTAAGGARLQLKYNDDRVPVLSTQTLVGNARSNRAAGTRIIGTDPSRYH